MRKMLAAFGFQEDWIEWVMNLVSSAFFSILVNVVPSGIIKPMRGIRQGDPLSPFLFIPMEEGLGSPITAIQDNNDLREIIVHTRADT